MKKDTCCGESADALSTQFNVTALVPSLKRLYVDLWDAIELSMLGYYDTSEDETVQQPQHRGLLYPPATHHSQYPVPAIMRILKTSVLPEIAEYQYFVVGFKPLATSGKQGYNKHSCYIYSSVRDSQISLIDFGWVLCPCFIVDFTSTSSSLRHCCQQVIFPWSQGLFEETF